MPLEAIVFFVIFAIWTQSCIKKKPSKPSKTPEEELVDSIIEVVKNHLDNNKE